MKRRVMKNSESQKSQCNQCTKVQDTSSAGAQAKVDTGIGARTETKSAKVAMISMEREAEVREGGRKGGHFGSNTRESERERFGRFTIGLVSNFVRSKSLSMSIPACVPCWNAPMCRWHCVGACRFGHYDESEVPVQHDVLRALSAEVGAAECSSAVWRPT